MEFIFVTESATDPAYPALQKLKEEFPDRNITIAVAGQSWHNGQKIHNILEGLTHLSADSQFLLLLDADMMMHPGTVIAMVNGLQSDPRNFIASGSPVEVPPQGGSFIPYLYMAYRRLNLIAFKSEHVPYAWGGCMMLRTAEVRANMYGLLDKWRNGGYSDDQIATGCAWEGHRTIYSPRSAFFPTVLDKNVSFRSYWNFLSRQMYVIDTYTCRADRRANAWLLVGAISGGVAFTMPVLLLAFNLLSLLAYPLARLVGLSIPWVSGALVGATAYMLVVVGLAVAALEFLEYIITLMFTKLNLRCDHVKLGLAFIVYFGLMSIMAVRSVLTNDIIWAGIVYTKSGGRIVKVGQYAPTCPTHTPHMPHIRRWALVSCRLHLPHPPQRPGAAVQMTRRDENGKWVSKPASTTLPTAMELYRSRGWLVPPSSQILPEVFDMACEAMAQQRKRAAMNVSRPPTPPRSASTDNLHGAPIARSASARARDPAGLRAHAS
ncbi:putative ceramide glucosyltransferase 2 [Paratrimastix pyriformis]|uniref:ceramide glucosyltransferase n=1 Tax=Paratrimastix pyriformis TaxID=342808 RepID=A0ABQ8UJB9_9EUKA|nr:putative ceramide glucosyltransferase 2 [Paratrimastix pyriformis]